MAQPTVALKKQMKYFLSQSGKQADLLNAKQHLDKAIDKLPKNITGKELGLKEFVALMEHLEAKFFDRIEGFMDYSQERKVVELSGVFIDLAVAIQNIPSHDDRMSLFINNRGPYDKLGNYNERIRVVFGLAPQYDSRRSVMPVNNGRLHNDFTNADIEMARVYVRGEKRQVGEENQIQGNGEMTFLGSGMRMRGATSAFGHNKLIAVTSHRTPTGTHMQASARAETTTRVMGGGQTLGAAPRPGYGVRGYGYTGAHEGTSATGQGGYYWAR